MKKQDIQSVLEKHKKWLMKEDGGEKANLRDADLSGADLSSAEGLLSQIDFLKENFEMTDEGVVAYKVFNATYKSPERWKIEPGSIISENVNFFRTSTCGCGINVATYDWVKTTHGGKDWDIWKVLIRWEWLAGVCVPYNTNGKIRCERVELVGIVENKEEVVDGGKA